MSDPDVRLMLQVQRDRPGAFAELVERWWMRVFGRLYRLLDDRQEAEDMAQNVFLRLYRSRYRYRPRARFGTWLFHICQNVARNALRSRRRHACVLVGQLGQAEENDLPLEHLLHDRSDAPWRPLERAELAVAVRAAVATLAGRQRRAVELHQLQDWTYSEVAEELDMSPQAAKSLLYRARSQLRENLTPVLEALA